MKIRDDQQVIKETDVHQKGFCVVIGGANIDIAGVSHADIRMKDSNPGKITFSSGGVARNIAENLARLGVETIFLSCVGNDEFGDRILEECRSSGVDISHVKVSRDYPTSIYLSLHDKNGEMKLAVNDMEGVSDINRDYLDAHTEILQRASVIVADTNLEENVIEYLLTRYDRIPFFFDAVSAAKVIKLSRFLGRIHTLKPNRLEAEILTGIKLENDRDQDKAMDFLLEKGVKQVFISLGEEGIYYGNSEKRTFLKSFPVEVVSSTGSGDAFMGGLVHSYLTEGTIDHAAQSASCAAHLALQCPGAVYKEISAAMLEHMIKKGVN